MATMDIFEGDAFTIIELTPCAGEHSLQARDPVGRRPVLAARGARAHRRD